MRLEALAVGGRVVRIGMGPARAEATAGALFSQLGRGAADTAGHVVTGLVKGLVALRSLRTSIDRWPGEG